MGPGGTVILIYNMNSLIYYYYKGNNIPEDVVYGIILLL